MAQIKTREQISIMREGGGKLSSVLMRVCERAVVGANMHDLDEYAESLIRSEGGTPAFKGYGGFPGTLCTSVNNEVVHGAPLASKVLREGDIASFDIGMKYQGLYTDMAVTMIIGVASEEARRLVRATKKALKRGLKKVHAGVRTGDIGNTIQRYAEDQGFGVVKDLCGHGIGEDLHEDPQIPNFGKRGRGVMLQEGMVICIEPMLTMGSDQVIEGKDGHAYCTEDGSLAAHFECTLLVQERGHEVLTPLPLLDRTGGESS